MPKNKNPKFSTSDSFCLIASYISKCIWDNPILGASYNIKESRMGESSLEKYIEIVKQIITACISNQHTGPFILHRNCVAVPIYINSLPQVTAALLHFRFKWINLHATPQSSNISWVCSAAMQRNYGVVWRTFRLLNLNQLLTPICHQASEFAKNHRINSCNIKIWKPISLLN